MQNEKVNGVTADEIETQITNTKAFLNKVAKFYEPSNGTWLWGRITPTALDIHVAVFLARLEDVGRGELVPNELALFHEAVSKTTKWAEVYQGRSTMIGVASSKASL